MRKAIKHLLFQLTFAVVHNSQSSRTGKVYIRLVLFSANNLPGLGKSVQYSLDRPQRVTLYSIRQLLGRVQRPRLTPPGLCVTSQHFVYFTNKVRSYSEADFD
jgi:hypothetical protein